MRTLTHTHTHIYIYTYIHTYIYTYPSISYMLNYWPIYLIIYLQLSNCISLLLSLPPSNLLSLGKYHHSKMRPKSIMPVGTHREQGIEIATVLMRMWIGQRKSVCVCWGGGIETDINPQSIAKTKMTRA